MNLYAISELENELDSLVVQGRLTEPEVVVELTTFLDRLLRLMLCFPEYDAQLLRVIDTLAEQLILNEEISEAHCGACGVVLSAEQYGIGGRVFCSVEHRDQFISQCQTIST